MVENFLKIETIFRVPVPLVVEALTSEELIKKYTQSDVKFEYKENGQFSLYSGYITGEILEIKENKSITMNWSFNTWIESCTAIYKFSEQKGNETLLTVHLKNVPSRDKFGKTVEHEEIIAGFKSQIFDKISTWLGYAQNKDNEDSDSD